MREGIKTITIEPASGVSVLGNSEGFSAQSEHESADEGEVVQLKLDTQAEHEFTQQNKTAKQDATPSHTCYSVVWVVV